MRAVKQVPLGSYVGHHAGSGRHRTAGLHLVPQYSTQTQHLPQRDKSMNLGKLEEACLHDEYTRENPYEEV